MPGFCEHCRTYFGARFAGCPLCRGQLDLAAGTPEGAWVVVAVARNPTEADILGGLLAANGIRSVVDSRVMSMYPTPDSGWDLVLLLVPNDAVEAAEGLLDAAERGELVVSEQEREDA